MQRQRSITQLQAIALQGIDASGTGILVGSPGQTAAFVPDIRFQTYFPVAEMQVTDQFALPDRFRMGQFRMLLVQLVQLRETAGERLPIFR